MPGFAVTLSVSIIAFAPPAEGTLFVSGYASNNVHRYDAVTGAFLGTLDTSGGIAGPLGLAMGADGLLYVASENTDQVLRFDPQTGDFIDEFIGPASGLTEPAGLTFGPDRNGDLINDLYVSSFNGDSVLVFNALSGASLGTFVTSGSGGLNGPDAGMTFGSDGDLYVPSFWSNRVLRYNGATGAFVETVVSPGACGMNWPRTIVFDPVDDDMLVTCEATDRVSRYFDAGCSILVFGIPEPTGMVMDSAGYLYVASLANDAVNRYVAATGAPQGTPVTSGAGGLDLPTFILLVEDPIPCVGDVDDDGTVGLQDLLALLAAWGPCPGCAADLDDDGMVSANDLLVLLSAWGPC